MPDNGNASTSTNGGGKKSTFGFLAKKIGPVPVWVIILAAVALWYWYFHYGPGAKKAQAQKSQQAIGKAAQTGQVINVHIVDTDRRTTGTGHTHEDHDDRDRRGDARQDEEHRDDEEQRDDQGALEQGQAANLGTRWRSAA